MGELLVSDESVRAYDEQLASEAGGVMLAGSVEVDMVYVSPEASIDFETDDSSQADPDEVAFRDINPPAKYKRHTHEDGSWTHRSTDVAESNVAFPVQVPVTRYRRRKGSGIHWGRK